MEKYMEAIKQLARYGAYLSCDKGYSDWKIFKILDHQSVGVIDVAMYDSSISNDDFMKIQEEVSVLVDMYYQNWNREEEEKLKCLLSSVK